MQTRAGKNRQQRFNYREKVNRQRIDSVVGQLGVTGAESNKLRQILQGRSGLHTKATLDRVKKISKQVKQGKFSIKRYIAKDPAYNEVRRYIKSNTSVSEVLRATERTEFYYQEREFITDYNENPTAKNRMLLENRYNDFRDDEDTRSVKTRKLAKL